MVSVLLSASVKRFSVSRMQDFSVQPTNETISLSCAIVSEKSRYLKSISGVLANHRGGRYIKKLDELRSTSGYLAHPSADNWLNTLLF